MGKSPKEQGFRAAHRWAMLDEEVDYLESQTRVNDVVERRLKGAKTARAKAMEQAYSKMVSIRGQGMRKFRTEFEKSAQELQDLTTNLNLLPLQEQIEDSLSTALQDNPIRIT